jgi:hypothetical protein
VGPAPDRAELIEPTIEDGYLLMVGRLPDEVAA